MPHWKNVAGIRYFARKFRRPGVDGLGPSSGFASKCAQCAQLAIYDAHRPHRSVARHGPTDIPLDAIRGTLEPHRAAHFDRDFRPSAPARSRWLRVWLAEQRGAVLPPISVASVGDAYAIRDGHHRVSVARARGALTISAVVA